MAGRRPGSDETRPGRPRRRSVGSPAAGGLGRWLPHTRLQVVTRLVKPVVFALALVPLAVLVQRTVAGDLGANPVETITHETGSWALRLLLATLAVTPARRLTGWNELVRLRRMLGLLAFFYASLHFLTYAWLDQAWAWADVVEDVAKRPYVTLGFTAFVLLVPLAATSTDGMIRRLGGQRWRRLHRLVYVAAAAGCVHYLWLVKADLRDPLLYLGILGVLLALRLTPPQALAGRAEARS